MNIDYYSERQVTLQNMLHHLWEQHVMWTRSFIISTAEKLGDAEYVTDRLLRNPSDMADVLEQFYGSKIAMEFEQLFREHLLIAADLVNAAIAGDSDKVEKTRAEWYENADEIAKFLSSINPYWQYEIWREMLFEHLKMTEDEAVARISKKYQDDVNMFDAIENQALAMADYMFDGILMQFMY